MKITVEEAPKKEIKLTSTSIISYTVSREAARDFYAIVMETENQFGNKCFQINRLSCSTILIKPQPSLGKLVKALEEDDYVVSWELVPLENVSMTIKK